LADIAVQAGIQRVHVLAWRDLDDPEAGGSELHAHQILRRWAAAGLDVTMRTSAALGLPEHADRDGYRVMRAGGRISVFPRTIAAELAGLRGPRDAVVEILNGVPWFSPLWARCPRTIWLHHVHGPMWPLMLPSRLARLGQVLEDRLAPPVYRREKIVTLAESSRRELIDELGFAPQRIEVVNVGVDEHFSPGGDKSAVPLVLAVGRMAPAKRFDAVVRAAAEARRTVPDLQLVIVGDGDERGKVEATIADLGAGPSGAGWVHLPGSVSDAELLDLYRRAWVLTSASVAEGWGMTITEAAACGTPAVVTDITGHSDAVRHGRSGLLVPDGELGAALALALTDDSLRGRLASGALARAAELSWDRTAEQTLSILAEQALRHRWANA
jgi:glycosyltransferase involved in cell wall biosynthesis